MSKQRDYHTIIIDRIQAAIVCAAYAVMMASISAAAYYGLTFYLVLLRLGGG